MSGYVKTPLGWMNLYDISISIGIVIALVVQGVLLVRYFKKYRYLLFLSCYGILLYLGQYASAFVRCANDGAFDGKMDISTAVVNLVGSHFLGHVIMFSILLLPLVWFIIDIFVDTTKENMCVRNEVIKIGEILFLGLPIQHIFNRIGCLCQGCCYGVRYEGVFSIILVNNKDINYRVFPCQILEIVCMIILLILVCSMLKKEKNIVGAIVIGFSLTFFLSEFFTENPYAIKHFGLTYVQFFSVGEAILGIVYYKVHNKLPKDKEMAISNSK